MTEPWKRFLILVGISLVVLALIYFFAELVLFKTILTLCMLFIWPFYGVYTYLLIRKDKDNEVTSE